MRYIFGFNSDQPILTKKLFLCKFFLLISTGLPITHDQMLIFRQENEFRTGLSSNLVPWIDRFGRNCLYMLNTYFFTVDSADRPLTLFKCRKELSLSLRRKRLISLCLIKMIKTMSIFYPPGSRKSRSRRWTNHRTLLTLRRSRRRLSFLQRRWTFT